MQQFLTIERTWDGQPADPAERAEVILTQEEDGLLIEIDAPRYGDPLPDQPPGPTDALWEHEVVEVLLLGRDQRYLEVEVGPAGHYLVLELAGVRNPVRSKIPVEITWRPSAPTAGRWSAAARIPTELLPPGLDRVNAYAMHGSGAERRYLAYHSISGDAPDFHRLDAFPELCWS